MFSSNTETGISVTYQDGDGTLDLVIGDDVIVQSMIADNAIDSQHYVDGSIDTAHYADNSITGDELADNIVIAGTLGAAGGTTNGIAISQGAIKIKNGGSKSYIDLYCESSNAHYTRIEAAAHSAYSGNVTVTLPVATGTLALTDDIHTTEELQDIIGAMVSSNTESGITVAYQDADGTIDFTVGTLNQNTSGTAATVTGAAQSNITSLGTLTTLTVDDITINGSTISDGGDMTIDIGGDLTIDAAGNDIKFFDNGTQIGQIEMAASSGFHFRSIEQDADLRFKGNDGGSTITALLLDMSAAGAATFNSKVTVGTNAVGTLTTDNDGSFDLAASNNFKCTPAGNFTLTFTNIVSQSGNILLINSGGHTVSAHSNTKVDANFLATVSVAGTYLLAYFSDGTNVYMTNSAIYS